jgi:hypothetical protein
MLMQHIKTIALAALATLALAAFAASSASAATICSTAGTGTACKSGHGNQYSGSIVASNAGNVIFSFTNAEGKVINTVASTSSVIEGKITNSEEGIGDITKLTFSGVSSGTCSSVAFTTTASATNPWAISVSADGGTEDTNGILTIKGVSISFTCTFLGFPVTCKSSASTSEMTIDGSDTEPKITANNVLLAGEAGNNASVCGTSVDWSATYKITTPSSLFVE